MAEATLKQLVANRVVAGVKFLDKKFPGWEDDVDLDTLDLSDGRLCMLGQLGGKHAVELGFEVVSYDPDGHARIADPDYPEETWTIDYSDVFDKLQQEDVKFNPGAKGFDVYGAYPHHALSVDVYDVLTEAWKKKIRERVEAKRKGAS